MYAHPVKFAVPARYNLYTMLCIIINTSVITIEAAGHRTSTIRMEVHMLSF